MSDDTESVRARLFKMASKMVRPLLSIHRDLELEDVVQDAFILVIRNQRKRGTLEIADWHLRCRILDVIDHHMRKKNLRTTAVDSIDNRSAPSEAIPFWDTVADVSLNPEQAYIEREPVPAYVWPGKAHFMRWS